MDTFRLEVNYSAQKLENEKLCSSDSPGAKQICENGVILIDLARSGRLDVIRKIVEVGEQPWYLMSYYIIQMFHEACYARHIDILLYMCNSGLSLRHDSFTSISHDLIMKIHKNRENESEYQSVFHYLLQNGVDVNYQRTTDYYTPLHLACELGLYSIVYLLLLYDADVNAVANNDMTPMLCALRSLQDKKDLSPSDIKNYNEIIKCLDESHAIVHWRTPKPTKNFTEIIKHP